MTRTSTAAFALGIALAPALFGGPARVTFTRVVPPPHDLRPAERIAVVYAIGDNDKVTTFIDHFVEYASRGGTLRIENAVDNNQHLASFNERTLRALRRSNPADAYIGVSLFTCAGEERKGEVGDTSLSGERIRSKVRWLDAICSAKIDVRKADGKQLATFMAHGEGTSPRDPELTADERDIAYEQATKFAAISAAESITPRVLRESIELDDRAPAFEEAMAMINSDRLTDARAIWMAALARHRDSAALYYDLAAVCEALGDTAPAEEYLRSAVRIAPKETRYRAELGRFSKRNATRKN